MRVCRVAYTSRSFRRRVVIALLGFVTIEGSAYAQEPPRLFYESDGDGVPVVFLADWAHDTGSWFALLPLLREPGRRLIRYDLRGQGRSEAPANDDYSLAAHRSDLLRLLDGLGIARAHLVGTGVGATIAVSFALEHPDRTGSVCAIAPRLAWTDAERAEWERLIEAWERVGRPTMGEYASVLAARWLGTRFVERNPWTVDWYDLMLRRQSGSALVASLRSALSIGLDLESAGPVEVPALVVIGERGATGIGPGGLGAAFPVQWRERIDDAGGQPAIEAPRELAEALAPFLERVTAGT